MEIEYGAVIKDKNGEVLGTVNHVLRDTWTGDISKISISTELAEADLFYSTNDIAEATGKEVNLKIAFGESTHAGINYGAKVIDSNGKELGTVDYPITDSLTGEITKFKVSSDDSNKDTFFSIDDVDKATPSEVKLKITFNKHVSSE